jgi:hypothetical protein
MGIALEMQAYVLTASYESQPDQIFSVEDAVRQSIQRQEF